MAPMKAAELVKHPEFNKLTLDLAPTTKEKLPIATGRGGPFKIAYEVHGHGDNHLLWIMGLGAFKTAWQRQTKHFGHGQASKYSCLIFDNRGIGESDKPLLRYTTSEMALDTKEVLDHIGWTKERSVHVIGVSMGGMIAQELAMIMPKRIASLSLISTAAHIQNTVGFVQNLRDRINLVIPKSIDVEIEDVKHRLFNDDFSELPDGDGDWPTNGDRFAAQEVKKRMDTEGFTRRGFLCQLVAAGWHHKNAAQLKQIGDTVGRERIQIMHGTDDRMISFPHSDVLISGLGGRESELTVHIFEHGGHMLGWEKRKEHNQAIVDLVEKTSKMAKDK